MGTVILHWIVRIVSLSWLTGPIFDKELRVSSRRRRSYVLRCLYIGFFAVLTSLVWIEAVPRSSSSLFQASRMAQAGQGIVMFVVWFQFIAAQLVAIVMLSTAISDEIYSKTLGLLMTTPIGSFQIVLGKLLSKLLQLLLLLAITLPLLAIVRVFGGVPWEFLVCGLALTLSTCVFYGTLSLFFSIFTRRAHTVIIATIITAGVLFLLVPILSFLVFHDVVSEQIVAERLALINPYMMLTMTSAFLFGARGMGRMPWVIHCGIALAVSVLLMLLAALFVRKVALRQATGQEIFGAGRRRRREGPEGGRPGRVRRVVGSCIFWKERRTPLLGRFSILRLIIGVLLLGLLLLTYGLCFWEHDVLEEDGTQIGYVVVFTGLGILLTMILPATSITSEKESRSWPILLTTTVSNGQILWGKFLGAIRRCSVAWLLLALHAAVFVALGVLQPVIMFHLGIIVPSVVVFLCGSGLYFSVRCRRTTTAVIANVGLAAGLWAIIPLLMALLTMAVHGDEDVLALYMDTNPFVQAVVVTAAAAPQGSLHRYDWIQGGMRDVESSTLWICTVGLLYVIAGLLFLWRAGARLRQQPV